MEVLQAMQKMMDAHQARMEAIMRAGREEMMAESRAWREKIEARTTATQAKKESIRATTRALRGERTEANSHACLKETVACQEMTEANPEFSEESESAQRVLVKRVSSEVGGSQRRVRRVAED
jgi:tyrosyl-tRNA synthetase